MLVMDEADLLFSYGYEENIRSLLPHLPPIFQAVLLSATLSDVRECFTSCTVYNTFRSTPALKGYIVCWH
jgi:ATP-dependent RNA helicase DDX56/DBP9